MQPHKGINFVELLHFGCFLHFCNSVVWNLFVVPAAAHANTKVANYRLNGIGNRISIGFLLLPINPPLVSIHFVAAWY